jgi:hypothetical protein
VYLITLLTMILIARLEALLTDDAADRAVDFALEGVDGVLG